jgi:hypothetical protein
VLLFRERRPSLFEQRNTFMIITDHPPVLCSASIVREDDKSATPYAIRSVALFTATREGEDELCFELQHLTFRPGVPNGEILAGLCGNVPPGAALLLRGAPPRPNALSEAIAAGLPLAPNDVQLCKRRLVDASIIALDCSDENLERIGAALGLRMPSAHADITERCRRAPQSAQALWASFVASACSTEHARSFVAAFRAWNALERARPLHF